MFYLVDDTLAAPPWNKGKLIGQKKPLKLKEIWTIRVRLQMAGDVRGLALFNLAIDSKLRGCDLVKISICPLGSTPGSCTGGLARLDSIRVTMAGIRCGGPRHR